MSTIELVNRFDPEEAAFIHANGSATIKGQAFLRRSNGTVVYGAGSEITLVPSTPYSDERIEKIYRGGKRAYLYGTEVLEDPDPRYSDFFRTTKGDGEGRFVFENVPVGKYYLTTQISWKSNTGDYIAEGGNLVETMIVSREENEYNIILSGS